MQLYKLYTVLSIDRYITFRQNEKDDIVLLKNIFFLSLFSSLLFFEFGSYYFLVMSRCGAVSLRHMA